MITEFIEVLSSQFAQQSTAELIAVILAVAYVWLAAKENVWCWPAALLSTGLYSWIFWDVSLPFNSALNGYYLIMAVYGWYKWTSFKGGERLEIRTWPLYFHLVACSSLLLIGVGLTHLVTMSWVGNHQYLDALVTVFSVYTTYLVTQKVLENWIFWMVINCFAAYLYFVNGLLLTGLLFLSYFAFAIYGYSNWKKLSATA